jgi:hypothetical protein
VELLSTWKDIVDLIPQLWDKDTRELISAKSKQDLLVAIVAADHQIRAELSGVYNDMTGIATWYKPPVNDPGNHNSASCLLPNLTLGTGLKTEVITLTFNSASSFIAFGDFSGPLGSGSKSSTFSCSTLSIPASAWYGTHSSGDIVYIRTYLSDPRICDAASAPLAAANVLDSIYTDQIPNSLDTSNKFRQQAIGFLKRLNAQAAGLEKPAIAVDLTPEKIDYNVNEAGFDISEYQE